jgi:large subunit ribosomal protein L21
MKAQGVGMFAIVEVGGKQYRVEEGGQIVVDRLGTAEGKTVELRPLLVADGDDVHFGDEGKKPKVTANVVEHLRGPKITISRFKPKRGWRKKTGFRSALTRLEVKKITFDGKKTSQEALATEKVTEEASTAKKIAVKEAPAARTGAKESASAPKKTVAKEAPAARKTVAKEAPAAKKTAAKGVSAIKNAAKESPAAKKSTQEG